MKVKLTKTGSLRVTEPGLPDLLVPASVMKAHYREPEMLKLEGYLKLTGVLCPCCASEIVDAANRLNPAPPYMGELGSSLIN